MTRIAAFSILAIAFVFAINISSCKISAENEAPRDLPPFVRGARVTEHSCHYNQRTGLAVFHIDDRGRSRWIETRLENVTLKFHDFNYECYVLLDADMYNYSRADRVTVHLYSSRAYQRWQSRLKDWQTPAETQ